MKFLNGWTKKKVIKHIEENFKGKAYNKEIGICEYQTKTGKKCAVGLFIPDRHEGKKFQGSVHDLVSFSPDLKKILPMDLKSLAEIQEIHDQADFDYQSDDNRTDAEVLMDLISFIESEA